MSDGTGRVIFVSTSKALTDLEFTCAGRVYFLEVFYLSEGSAYDFVKMYYSILSTVYFYFHGFFKV